MSEETTEPKEIDWKNLYHQVVADNERLREEKADYILRDGQEVFSWDTLHNIISNRYFIGAIWGATILCIILLVFFQDR